MIALKPDVTLDELAAYVKAAVSLRKASEHLRDVRASKHYGYLISSYETAVCDSLDRLWEAQQHVAA